MPFSFVLPDLTPLSSDPAERVRQQSRGLNNIVFSPTGRLIAISDVRMNVWVRREQEIVFSANYENINPKIRATDRIRDLAFQGDRYLWIAAGESVRKIDLNEGRELLNYVAPRDWGFLVISPTSIAIAPNGWVAVAFDNGGIAIWSEYGELVQQWTDNDGPRKTSFLDDGERLFGTDSFSLCIWEVATREKIHRWPLEGRAFGVAVCPEYKWVATRGLHEAVVWDLRTGTPFARFNVRPGLPLLQFHPTRPWLGLGAQNGIDVIDVSLSERVEWLPLEGMSLISFAFSPEGDLVLAGTSEETLIGFSQIGK